MKEVNANPAAFLNSGTIQAGRVLGIIATILSGLAIVIFVFMTIMLGGSMWTLINVGLADL